VRAMNGTGGTQHFLSAKFVGETIVTAIDSRGGNWSFTDSSLHSKHCREAVARRLGEPLNRHRGESHLSSPATPPDRRVRIRRFSSVGLEHIQQSRKTECVKESNG